MKNLLLSIIVLVIGVTIVNAFNDEFGNVVAREPERYSIGRYQLHIEQYVSSQDWSKVILLDTSTGKVWYGTGDKLEKWNLVFGKFVQDYNNEAR